MNVRFSDGKMINLHEGGEAGTKIKDRYVE